MSYLLRVTHRVYPGSALQWQPTTTQHDPNPPITLEDVPLPVPLDYPDILPRRHALSTHGLPTHVGPLVVSAVVEATASSNIGVIPPLSLLQYQEVGAPVFLPSLVPMPAPTFPVRLLPAARVVEMPALFAPISVPAIPAPRLATATSSISVIAKRIRLQIQELGAPVTVPTAAVPDVPPSFPVQHIPVRRVPEFPAVTAPWYVPDVTQPVTAMSWRGTAPDWLARAPRSADFPAYTAPTYVPDVTQPVADLSWQGTWQDWIARPSRAPDFPAYVAPHYVPDVTQPTPALAWGPTYLDWIARPPRSVEFPQPATPWYVPDVTYPVTPLSWKGVWQDWIACPPRSADFPAYAAPSWVPDVTQPVPDLAWDPTYQDWIARPSRAADFPHLAAPWYVPDVTQPVAALSWHGWTPDWLARPPRSADFPAYTAPHWVPDVTQPVAALEWEPEYPVALDRRHVLSATQLAWQAPSWVPDVTQPVAAVEWLPVHPAWHARAGRVPAFPAYASPDWATVEVTPAPDLSWQGSAPAWVARRTLPSALLPGWTAPLYVADVTVLSVGVAGSNVTVVPPLTLLQYQEMGAPVTIPAAGVPDLVGLLPSVPVRPRLQQVPADSVAPLYVPDVTQPVAAVEWLPTTPAWIDAPARCVDFPAVWFVPDIQIPRLATATSNINVIARRIRLQVQEIGAPVMVPAAAGVPDLVGFLPSVPVRSRLRQVLPDSVAPLYVPDVTHPVTALSWGGVWPTTLLRPRLPLLWQSYAAPTSPPAPPEALQVPTAGGPLTVIPPLLLLQVQEIAAPMLPPTPPPPAPDLAVPPVMTVRYRTSAHAVHLTYVTPVEPLPPFPMRGGMLASVVWPPSVLQYPAVAGPISREAAPDLPDLEWALTIPAWIARQVFSPALQQVEAFPLYVPDVTQPTPALAWKGLYPDWHARRSRHASFVPSFELDVVPRPIAAPDLAQPIYPDILRAIPRVLAPALFWDTVLTPTDVRPDLMFPQYPAWIARPWRPLYGGEVLPYYVPDVTYPVPPLAWQGYQPERVFRHQMRAALQRGLAWSTATPTTPGAGQPPGCVSF